MSEAPRGAKIKGAVSGEGLTCPGAASSSRGVEAQASMQQHLSSTKEKLPYTEDNTDKKVTKNITLETGLKISLRRNCKYQMDNADPLNSKFKITEYKQGQDPANDCLSKEAIVPQSRRSKHSTQSQSYRRKNQVPHSMSATKYDSEDDNSVESNDKMKSKSSKDTASESKSNTSKKNHSKIKKEPSVLPPSPPSSSDESETASKAPIITTWSDDHLEKMNSQLLERLDDAKLKRGQNCPDNSNNIQTCNTITKHIWNHLKDKSKLPWEQMNTGSHYDKTQIRQAVEFDTLMSISNKSIKAVYHPETENNDRSMCCLSYWVGRNTSDTRDYGIIPHSFLSSERNLKGERAYLSPKKFYSHFEFWVSDFLKEPPSGFFEELKSCGWKCPKKNLSILKIENKAGCPAVTLEVRKNGDPLFSIDLVPAIKVLGWPEPAKAWTCMWIPKQIRDIYKCTSTLCLELTQRYNIFHNKHVYAVPKLDQSEIDKFPDECKYFQLSFTEIEKNIIKHLGKEFAKGCMKNLLKLLKLDLYEFDEINKKYLQGNKKVISSYHMKQTLFAYRRQTVKKDWEEGYLSVRYKECLEKFTEIIRDEKLPMFFIQNVNLLKDKLDGDMKSRILDFFNMKLESF